MFPESSRSYCQEGFDERHQASRAAVQRDAVSPEPSEGNPRHSEGGGFCRGVRRRDHRVLGRRIAGVGRERQQRSQGMQVW